MPLRHRYQSGAQRSTLIDTDERTAAAGQEQLCPKPEVSQPVALLPLLLHSNTRVQKPRCEAGSIDSDSAADSIIRKELRGALYHTDPDNQINSNPDLRLIGSLLDVVNTLMSSMLAHVFGARG